MTLRQAGDTPPDEIAETRFALARALWDGKGDRARAHELAKQAREGLSGASAQVTRARAAVDAWLRSTGGG
jgi:hypothetical protein